LKKIPHLAWFFACLLLAPTISGARITSHLTHYGAWKESDIPLFQRFGLVALQAGNYTPSASEAQAIARVRANGTKVLLYVSLGEDITTFGQAPPAHGDGRGPSHFDDKKGAIVYENKGMASYYLDEWNAKGADADGVNKVPDGLPDRQGDWGACLVNAGDTAWQRVVLTEATRLMALGADGLFMDTPETAAPWQGYGWTAPGMHDLIRRIRQAFPDKFLLLNRGLFFFDPDYPLQYASSPRTYVDAVLFESYYTGSNYTTEQGGNGIWQPSPYFPSNKYVNAPRLNAEMNRPDSRGTVFHLDYVADPVRVVQDHPEVFRTIQREAVLEQGWVPEINDRLLGQAPTLFFDNPAPADRDAPKWSTTVPSGTDTAHPPAPRAGLLKAIPGNGKVTLRWDVAADQTWPIKYNVYYSKNAPLDFDASPRLAGVATEIGADYTDRARNGADDGCPYQFTVTGLENNALYRFAIRAEDGTAGSAPASGHTGPGGGIEETNGMVLTAIPQDLSAHAVSIDGTFGDWGTLTAIPDPAGDGSGVDFTGLSATDDKDYLYLYLQHQGNADPAKTTLLFNSDRRGNTGDPTPAGSGFHGADYKWEDETIYKYEDSDWTETTAASSMEFSGNKMELRISKKDIGAAGTGIDLLATSIDGRETLPNLGLTGFSYSFTHGVIEPIASPDRTLHSALRLRGGPGGLTIGFSNPAGRAQIGIYGLDGKLLLDRRGLGGEEFTWTESSTGAAVVLIRVQAEGQAPVSRLWIP
jgi:hypothetical protein